MGEPNLEKDEGWMEDEGKLDLLAQYNYNEGKKRVHIFNPQVVVKILIWFDCQS